jgi:hypothetical protein
LEGAVKREICCDGCARSWLRTNGIRVSPDGTVPASKAFELADGETIKQVRGPLTQGAMCDGCGTELPVGTVAVAVSLYSRSLPYFAWEDEFITPRTPGTR